MSSYSKPTLIERGEASAQIGEASPRIILLLSLFFVLPLLPYLVTALRLHYTAYNNSSDTFIYFDIARNFAQGRGLVLSFNPYQYWESVFYPAMPFVHVGFSIFLSLLYFFLPSIQKLIYFNFIFAFINTWLIYLIVKKIFSDRALAAWVGCILAASVSMEITLLRLLTEQLSLFVTLVSICLFVSKEELNRRDLFVIGVLLGIGFLIRASSIVYPLAFFLAVFFARKRPAFKLAEFSLILWPLVIAVSYAALIYLRYGAMFPEYPKAFHNYYTATFITGGGFFAQQPVIRAVMKNSLDTVYFLNMRDMFLVLFCIVRVLLFFAIARFFNIFKTRKKDELLLFWLSFVAAVSTLLFYRYNIVAEFQWTRFLLLPVVCLLALGAAGLRDTAQRFLPKTRRLFFHMVLFIIFVSNFYQSWRVLEVYWKKDEAREWVASLDTVYQWVRINIAPADTVAVSLFLLGRVYLERPTVILPQHKALNFENLRNFLLIYKPKAVIFENTMPLRFELDLARFGYKKAVSSPLGGVFWVFVPSAS